MMDGARIGLLLGLAMSALAPVAQAATLDGLTLSAAFYCPDSDTPYPDAGPTGPFVVGMGTEATIDVEGVTDLHLGFDGNSLTVTLLTTLVTPTWTDTAFNGLRIALGSGGTFTAFALASSTLAGPITPGFDDGELWFDWGGASYVDGSRVTIDVGYAPAPVPLPASLPLLAVGIGGLALQRRRRG